MKNALVITGIVSIIMVGCIETEQVSTIPHITFKNFELYQGYDSLGNKILIGDLKFAFIDGDADIDISSIEDTVPWNEKNHNVYLKPFDKIDTSYYAIPDDSANPPPYYLIRYNEKFDRSGQNKTVKGYITLRIKYPIIPPYDTIRYEFYIRDEANNYSNIEVTSDIGFKGISLKNSSDF